jgi:hypothetical protein
MEELGYFTKEEAEEFVEYLTVQDGTKNPVGYYIEQHGSNHYRVLVFWPMYSGIFLLEYGGWHNKQYNLPRVNTLWERRITQYDQLKRYGDISSEWEDSPPLVPGDTSLS